MTLGWLRWRLVAVGSPWRRGTLRGRHGTWRHLHALCVAGVAFMTLGWLRWRACHRWSPVALWHFAWQAWHLATSTCTLRGRRLCMAGVAVGDMDVAFAWPWRATPPSCRPCLHRRYPELLQAGPQHLLVLAAEVSGRWHADCCQAQALPTAFRAQPPVVSLTRAQLQKGAGERNTLSPTTLSHTQSFTHISLTCNFSLTHIFVAHSFVTHTQICHTQLLHTQLCHT